MKAAFLEQKAVNYSTDALRIGFNFRHIAGYSLLEVLISLCILSFGLLGFAQAQLLALRNNQIAYFQSIAQSRLFSLAEALQACNMAKCSMADINNEIQVWNVYNSYILPNGQGHLTEQDSHRIIILNWQTADREQVLNQAKLIIPILHA